MNYNEWAAEYLRDAGRIRCVIEKKKSLLNDKNLNSDTRKSILDTIASYRQIYRELLKTADTLRVRGEESHAA